MAIVAFIEILDNVVSSFVGAHQARNAEMFRFWPDIRAPASDRTVALEKMARQ